MTVNFCQSQSGVEKKPSVSFVALEILHNSNKTAATAACLFVTAELWLELPPFSPERKLPWQSYPHTLERDLDGGGFQDGSL